MCFGDSTQSKIGGRRADEPSSSGSSPRVRLDREILADLRELDEGEAQPFLAQMIRSFLESTPLHIERLRNAIAVGAVDAVGTVAHKLQGSSGALGARTMNDICAGLQRAARAASLAGGNDLIERLEEEFRALTRDLALVLADLDRREASVTQ